MQQRYFGRVNVSDVKPAHYQRAERCPLCGTVLDFSHWTHEYLQRCECGYAHRVFGPYDAEADACDCCPVPEGFVHQTEFAAVDSEMLRRLTAVPKTRWHGTLRYGPKDTDAVELDPVQLLPRDD